MNEILISVSEINNYLQCRRSWDFTSNMRQSLRHKVTPKLYFTVGTGLHKAIEANINGQDPHEAIMTYIQKEREDREALYEEKVGYPPWTGEWSDFEENAELTERLVNQYFQHYGYMNPLQDVGLKYLAAEIPFKIPLFDGIFLVGTIDAIATDIETESRFFLVENKSYEKRPDLETVHASNQFKCYAWAFFVLTGQYPEGILYNGITRKLAEPPKVLKNGQLSQNKTAPVTYRTFERALLDGDYDPEKYLEYMEFLQERDLTDNKFFHREILTYTSTQLDNWYGYVLEMVPQEMVNEPRIYPHFGSNCRTCLVKDLCDALQNGEDVETFKTQRYEVGQYGTMSSVKAVQPTQVISIETLIESLKNG